MVSAILLAAGTSSRMGGKNKLLLLYKNKPFIRLVTENLVAAGLKEIIVVTGFSADGISEALSGLPVMFTHNPDYLQGMTTSIQHGIRSAGGSGYMICLGDMVHIEAIEYRNLELAFVKYMETDRDCICMPSHDGSGGNPVIFSAAYREALLHHEEMEGCKRIVQENATHLKLVPMATQHILQDIDYPADYDRLTAT